MTSLVAIDELRARRLAANTTSHEASARSSQLCAAARRCIVQAARTRTTAQALRGQRSRHRRPSFEAFRVEGLVDEVPVTAVFADGRLDCSAELLARAEIVVDLGETFGGDDLPSVEASLTDGPTAALLTVMRAMSVVHSLDIVPGTR